MEAAACLRPARIPPSYVYTVGLLVKSTMSTWRAGERVPASPGTVHVTLCLANLPVADGGCTGRRGPGLGTAAPGEIARDDRPPCAAALAAAHEQDGYHDDHDDDESDADEHGDVPSVWLGRGRGLGLVRGHRIQPRPHLRDRQLDVVAGPFVLGHRVTSGLMALIVHGSGACMAARAMP